MYERFEIKVYVLWISYNELLGLGEFYCHQQLLIDFNSYDIVFK